MVGCNLCIWYVFIWYVHKVLYYYLKKDIFNIGVRVEKLKILQNFLESMKDYNNSNFNYKREETLKLKSPLYLVLGSLRRFEKWILFFIDRVNIKLLQNFSLWITNGVAQLLSNEISKRFGQNLNSVSLCRRVELF